ncbi:hypothetical protein B0O99DRAFT_559710 [Bisporella sp. PMI_857]|nr:hypothetical protein B0O99DRAFT_559710 [Bisporella sp. PMI_857]
MSSSTNFTDCSEDYKSNHVGDGRDSHELLLSGFSKLNIIERHQKRRLFLMVGMMVLLCINLLWSLGLFFTSIRAKTTGPSLIHSPAREAVFWEKVVSNSTVEFDPTNVYKGEPRPELDKAWEESYLQWSQIIVSEGDLKAIDRTSIRLTDGSGYLGTLGVFHQLHCLDYIRKYMYPDYYHSAETPMRNRQHVDHCIDEIRLSILCHGDISVITWGWKDTEATPYANFKVEHECRNWDSILGWTKAHQADQSAVVRPA